MKKLYMCTDMPTVSTWSWWRVPNQASILFVFFNLVDTFITRSPKRHAAFVKMQQSMYPDQRVCELKRLSDTWWACREDGLRSLKRVLPGMVKLLKNMADSDPPDALA